MSHLYANGEVPHIGDTVKRIANYDYGGISPREQAVVTNITTISPTYIILELNGVVYYNHVPHNYELLGLYDGFDCDARSEHVAKRKKQKPKGGFARFMRKIEEII